jgi:hypothetical protein
MAAVITAGMVVLVEVDVEWPHTVVQAAGIN